MAAAISCRHRSRDGFTTGAHTPPGLQGQRHPLTARRSREKPDGCKHGFPKTTQTCDHPRIFCTGMATRLGLPGKGKRNAVGTFLPSRSSGTLNGAVPALLVASGDNDIKNPTRLVISSKTHDKECEENGAQSNNLTAQVKAMEASQAAQVGYHCDYCNKRQPVGIHECKEWAKGHKTLEQGVKGERLSYKAKRHTPRIISD